MAEEIIAYMAHDPSPVVGLPSSSSYRDDWYTAYDYDEVTVTSQRYATSLTNIVSGLYTVTKIDVWLSRLNNDIEASAGNVTLVLRSGSLTGDVVGSAAISRLGISDFAKHTFTISGDFDSELDYYLIVTDASGITQFTPFDEAWDDFVRWHGRVVTGHYNGYVNNDYWGEWTALNGIRFVAYVYGESEDLPDKATNPAPANTATGVSVNLSELSWTQGNGADTEEVYFGPSGDLSLVQDGAGTTFDLSSYLPFPYGTTYQWRIDSTNDDGTTTGDTWSFTTMEFIPPEVSVFQVVKRLCACAENRFWIEDV